MSGVTVTERSGRGSPVRAAGGVSFFSSSGFVSGMDGVEVDGVVDGTGVLGSAGADGSLGGVGSLEDGGVDSVGDGGAGSVVDGGVLGSLVGVGAGSTLDVGVSGSCASAPVVAPPNARTTAVVRAPALSRARLIDLSDNESPWFRGWCGRHS
ncbi:hypothetical protein GCM10022267_03960 [Lentzea roselyniae]|uniref:Uncharacterized protein n=1 Tax=Lentzea roselyniae TaxID=531940 RepID=A0ABP6ZZG5_9PSEU